MRAENYLQYMADFYRDLFPTRKHALDHLFCVIGNGCKWVNGEIETDDELINRYQLKCDIERAMFRDEEAWIIKHDNWKKLYEIDNSFKIPWRYQFKWYPLSKEYSYLFNYPDDIKDDWMALINECRELLIADGIDLDEME